MLIPDGPNFFNWIFQNDIDLTTNLYYNNTLCFNGFRALLNYRFNLVCPAVLKFLSWLPKQSF